MKIIICFLCSLFLCSGCSKIADLASSKAHETEQTGDPVRDEQSEVKVLVPWTLVL